MRHLHALFNAVTDILHGFIKAVIDIIYSYIAVTAGVFVSFYTCFRCDFDWEATGWVAYNDEPQTKQNINPLQLDCWIDVQYV